MSASVLVLGFDGGLNHMGVVAARVDDLTGIDVVRAEVIVTQRGNVAKQASKERPGRGALTTASADNRRRVQELSARVALILDEVRPAVVVCEAFSRPPHASAGYALAMSLATIYVHAARFDIDIAEVSPQTSRAVLGVERGLTKEDGKRAIQEAVDARLWPALNVTLREQFLAKLPAGVHEHAYDAAAAIIAATEKNKLSRVLTLRV